ncbi:hypothetical protein EPUL_004439 [Erysiphe pulchra]|uniref:Sm domain-containing protein n=1 Tax=Erysiphe pulchra TaxID=225359 RepID=A0A2S4PVP3_9PEZI|nr:hypothetical protein EPUL_004439 [Erysiphe pulchra]
MSQRGQYRGNRGSNRGGRGGRGNFDGNKGSISTERPKKENILDLGKYMDKKISVKMSGGREVVGVLKGYDALMNLVLDDVEESMHGTLRSSIYDNSFFSLKLNGNELIVTNLDEENKTTTRSLGLVVVRGTLLVLISPVDGSEEIANPFVQTEE